MQLFSLFCVSALLVASTQAALLATPKKYVPVPPKPNVTLPDPRGHPESTSTEEPVSCSKLDACLAQADGKHEGRAASDFKACVQKFCEELYEGVPLNKSDDTRTAICDKKGKEVWKHISSAVAKVKTSFIEVRKSQPDVYNAMLQSLAARAETVHMAEICKIRQAARALRSSNLISSRVAPVKKVEVPPPPVAVPVPDKPDTKLAKPPNDAEPATCGRLDACLKQADENDEAKASADFKSCIQKFCEEAYEGIELNKSDDTRTQLCDEKGKELWNYIAKETAKVKTSSKGSLIQLRTRNPEMYEQVLKSLAALTSVVHVAEVCVMPHDVLTKEVKHDTKLVSDDHDHNSAGTKEATAKEATRFIDHIKAVRKEEAADKEETTKSDTDLGKVISQNKEESATPTVPLPPKTDAKLPDPHGTSDSKSPSKEPIACARIDECLEKTDAKSESKAAADFHSCIQKFCTELYADDDKTLPETRNVLCDQKGKEVWGYIAKQGAKVKTGGKASLFQFRTLKALTPDTYKKVVSSLFASSSSSKKNMVNACRLDGK